MVIDQAHGQYSSQLPIGLSSRESSKYGLVQRKRVGNLSSQDGGGALTAGAVGDGGTAEAGVAGVEEDED